MFIYTLLAILHDSLWTGDSKYNKVIINNDTVCVMVSDKKIINGLIIPICECILLEEAYESIENCDWSEVSLIFGKNPYNKRPELQRFDFANHNGFCLSCDVSKAILKLLTSEEKDELYYDLCEEIFCEILY